MISLAFTENGILFELKGEKEEKPIQLFNFLEQYGEMPLPPYIHYEKEKEQWYQTFFATTIGSAAAPTASLHFTPELMKRIEEKHIATCYLCLHVGL